MDWIELKTIRWDSGYAPPKNDSRSGEDRRGLSFFASLIMQENQPIKISNLESRIPNQGLIIAGILTVFLWGMHFVWFLNDTRPPVWDMALHQTYALNYSQAADAAGPANPWEKSGNYPPFVHLVIAAVFRIFHPGPHIAALANIPATFLLFWALYELARDMAGAAAARWACLLVWLTPYLIWTSRETILDYWLSAWFTAALVVLRKTRDFQSRPWSFLLGLIIGLGLLTKWFFAGIILFPFLYVIMRSRVWKDPQRCIHFFDTLIMGGVLACIWYVPNIPRLVRYFGENAGIGAREGEPPIFTFQSLIYYLRLLEGYQLFGVLFAVLVLACYFCWRKRPLKDGIFLFVSVGGVWLIMTLLRTKDPRFSMPLLGLLAIITGAWIQSWGETILAGLAKGGLVTLLCIQVYAANFGISWLPERVVLLSGYQGSLRWDWNLYLQNYFGIFGRPAKEDWKQDVILGKLAGDSHYKSAQPSLALVPDLPWFNEGNFTLYARMRGMRIRIQHLQSASEGIDSFRGYNYVLMIEGDQGMPWTTRDSNALNQIIVDNPAIFRLVELYRLPSGDTARLYFKETASQ
jgi:hypothetical protein